MSKNATQGSSDRRSVTALVRGLAILRCFDRPRIELSVSQIARQIGLSQPTTWRLCQTLIDQGFLVRALGGTALRIGAPALTLGYAAIKGLDVPGIALPYLRSLTDRVSGTTTLSVREGIEMISVEHCEGEFVLANQPIGWHAVLSSVPSGLAVLAVLPDGERSDAMRLLEARDPIAWPRRDARIAAARESYARDGVVTLAGMLDGQYAAVAVPLSEGDGEQKRHWAISCGGLRSRWDDEHLRAAGAELVALRAILQPALAAR